MVEVFVGMAVRRFASSRACVATLAFWPLTSRAFGAAALSFGL
jgi:hypothetical protein